MKTDYKHIFSPLTIKRTTIRNRIAMTPMGTNYGETSGEMSLRHINYYVERAKGGVGLIILENANVDYPVGSNGTSQIRIDHDSFMPRYYQLVETLHKHGASVAIQINHAGASASSARTGVPTVSSSNIPTKAGGEIPRPMTKEEILYTVKKYGDAAKRVQDIGFDAVEIHMGHTPTCSASSSPPSTTSGRTSSAALRRTVCASPGWCWRRCASASAPSSPSSSVSPPTRRCPAATPWRTPWTICSMWMSSWICMTCPVA